MKLHHYQAKNRRVNRRRLYEVAGHCYPGVTTILSATKPPEARAALQQWRQRVGAEAARSISGKASSAGTRLHKQIAAFLNQDAVEVPTDIVGYWDSILPILTEVETALLVEGAVWHDAGYVGFPDALVVYEDQLWVCDWKTALKPKKLAWIEDYCLQVAAYAEAIEQVYADQNITVAGALIAIALDGQPAQTFRLSQTDLALHWQGFQDRLAEFQALRNRSQVLK